MVDKKVFFITKKKKCGEGGFFFPDYIGGTRVGDTSPDCFFFLSLFSFRSSLLKINIKEKKGFGPDIEYRSLYHGVKCLSIQHKKKYEKEQKTLPKKKRIPFFSSYPTEID